MTMPAITRKAVPMDDRGAGGGGSKLLKLTGALGPSGNDRYSLAVSGRGRRIVSSLGSSR